MWSKPWSYKEGLTIGAGLLIIGILLQMTVPLMWIDKAETWALADELGVMELIRTETLTCYNGVQGDGCGHCPACTLRREGLEKYLKSKNQ